LWCNNMRGKLAIAAEAIEDECSSCEALGGTPPGPGVGTCCSPCFEIIGAGDADLDFDDHLDNNGCPTYDIY
jgi:hypothetical protein